MDCASASHRAQGLCTSIIFRNKLAKDTLAPSPPFFFSLLYPSPRGRAGALLQAGNVSANTNLDRPRLANVLPDTPLPLCFSLSCSLAPSLPFPLLSPKIKTLNLSPEGKALSQSERGLRDLGHDILRDTGRNQLPAASTIGSLTCVHILRGLQGVLISTKLGSLASLETTVFKDGKLKQSPAVALPECIGECRYANDLIQVLRL